LTLALSRKSKVYLLDEPLNGIDPISREKIITSILDSYSEEASILICSHLIYYIEKVYYGPFLNQIKQISIELGSRANIDLLSGAYTAVFLNIILAVIFFTATAYLLENKINI